MLLAIYCIEKLAQLQNYPTATAQITLWLLLPICHFETKVVWNHHGGLLVKFQYGQTPDYNETTEQS